MTMLYLNLCYNEECYKGTAMYYLCLHNTNLDSFLYWPLLRRGILFDLILYIPVNNFQLCRDRSSLVEPVLSKD